MKRRVGRRGVTALVLTAVASACGGSSGAGELASELGVDLDQMTQRESGLYVRDLSEGDGATAATGNTVVVHYTGWLPNGTKFDSSLDRGEPFEIPLGTGAVIRGWDEGVPGMKVGGRRQLVIPPDLAYGSRGAGGVIPPDATLVFEIELLEVR